MHKEFEVYKLNEEGVAKAKEIAIKFDALLESLETLCSRPSVSKGGITLPTNHAVNAREMSLVRTKLEEASFFAKKAMSLVSENQALLAGPC